MLHIEREGRKESMLNSYKFDSREYPLELQEPEMDAAKDARSTIAEARGTFAFGIAGQAKFAVKLKQAKPVPRGPMMYLWTGEVPDRRTGFPRAWHRARRARWHDPARPGRGPARRDEPAPGGP